MAKRAGKAAGKAAGDYETDRVVRAARDRPGSFGKGTSLAEIAKALNVSARPEKTRPVKRTLERADNGRRPRSPLPVAAGVKAERERQADKARAAAQHQSAVRRDEIKAGAATPETRRKLKTDQVRVWHNRGHLTRVQMVAAEDIHDVVCALTQAMYPSSPDPMGGGGSKSAPLVLDAWLGQLTSPDTRARMARAERRKYEDVYLPWLVALAKEPIRRTGRNGVTEDVTEAAAMVIALVIKNLPVAAIADTFGYRRDKRIILAIIGPALDRYAQMAGIGGSTNPAKTRVFHKGA